MDQKERDRLNDFRLAAVGHDWDDFVPAMIEEQEWWDLFGDDPVSLSEREALRPRLDDGRLLPDNCVIWERAKSFVITRSGDVLLEAEVQARIAQFAFSSDPGAAANERPRIVAGLTKSIWSNHVKLSVELIDHAEEAGAPIKSAEAARLAIQRLGRPKAATAEDDPAIRVPRHFYKLVLSALKERDVSGA